MRGMQERCPDAESQKFWLVCPSHPPAITLTLPKKVLAAQMMRFVFSQGWAMRHFCHERAEHLGTSAEWSYQ